LCVLVKTVYSRCDDDGKEFKTGMLSNTSPGKDSCVSFDISAISAKSHVNFKQVHQVDSQKCLTLFQIKGKFAQASIHILRRATFHV
jgi:hypothetical protein